MLKNILIPEVINNNFIFKQKTLGFDISKNHINAVIMDVYGKRQALIKHYSEEIFDSSLSTEKLAAAIKNVIKNAPKYDYIKISFPGNLVIFKELTLPFIDIEQIRSVLNSELESTIPFSIQDATYDFIVLNQNKKSKTTAILVGIARKKDVLELLEPFKQLGINPSNVIIDIIGNYGLLNNINSWVLNKNLLINIEYNYTNIVYLEDGKIKLIRSIQKGIFSIAHSLAQAEKLSFEQAVDYLNKFGYESEFDNQYSKVIEKILNDYATNIIFTLNSFKNSIPNFSQITEYAIIGKNENIKNFDKFLNNKLNLKSKVFNIGDILSDKLFKTDQKLTNSSILSITTAYPSTTSHGFNLLQKDLENYDISLLKKQLLFSLILIASIFGIIIGYSINQKNKLNNQINRLKNETINTLKDNFNISDPAILKNLSEVINSSSIKVNEERNIWFSFSTQTRFSFLKYLEELSKIIDKEAIGLQLKALSIANEIITIEGEVADFPALEILETELNKSELFSHVTIPQDTKFTIKMTIKKNEEKINENIK